MEFESFSEHVSMKTGPIRRSNASAKSIGITTQTHSNYRETDSQATTFTKTHNEDFTCHTVLELVLASLISLSTWRGWSVLEATVFSIFTTFLKVFEAIQNGAETLQSGAKSIQLGAEIATVYLESELNAAKVYRSTRCTLQEEAPPTHTVPSVQQPVEQTHDIPSDQPDLSTSSLSDAPLAPLPVPLIATIQQDPIVKSLSTRQDVPSTQLISTAPIIVQQEQPDTVTSVTTGCMPTTPTPIVQDSVAAAASTPTNVSDQDKGTHLVIAYQPILPEPSCYPHYLFDGSNVTQWLKDVQHVFRRYRTAEDDMIADIPYWTVNKSIKRQVEVAIYGTTTWNQACDQLKFEFAPRDSERFKSVRERLGDLGKGPILSDVTEVTDLIRDYAVAFKEAEEAKEPVYPDSYVYDVSRRISLEVMEKVSYREQVPIKVINSYSSTQFHKVIKRWAENELYIRNHYQGYDQTKRALIGTYYHNSHDPG
ncbi:hypothetical protein F5Y11DRAFT_337030 [Daldinia sp. FL1419]|nr:hypothetical protein F5Y11DRAFT_337030 [Daldinia sp. FL1419]